MTNELAVSEIESTPITKETIRAYVCKEATDQELVYFMTLCKAQNLNPFLKEAYLVKYGTYPATQIVAKDVFLKRANKNQDYAGFKAGVIVLRSETVVYQVGSMILSDDKILGGWSEVYRNGREPTRIEVSFDEYKGTTKDGKLNKQWDSKPGTMIRKVALVQAHREAFPHSFQGMYDESELSAIQRGHVASPEKPAIEMPKPIVEETTEEPAQEPTPTQSDTHEKSALSGMSEIRETQWIT